MRRIALLLIALQTSGCAMYASANAAHSHISGCVDNPAYGIIDALIASAAGVTLVATNVGLEQPVWFALPGVFALSATLGLIGVAQCRSEQANAPKADPSEFPYLQQPTDVAEPVDAGVAPSTDETGETGENATAEHELPAAQQGPVLQLSPDYKVGPGADAGVIDAGPPIDCSIYSCPAHTTCALDERNRARCVPD